jgi:hypothetical protein
MERWQFIESPTGDWYWLCSDVMSRRTRTSAATFESRAECVSDAMGSGYQNGAAPAGQATAGRTPHQHRRKFG